jgi:surface antigen
MIFKRKEPSNSLSTPHKFSIKLSNWVMLLVATQTALGSLLIIETVLIKKAEALPPTVTSCRNIDVRVTTAKNKNLSKGFFVTTCGYTLQFQNDGNLVLTNKSGQALWATGSEGKAAILVMQADGNLVMYSDRRQPIWASNTSGNPGAFISLQNDGNLVIYQKNRAKALWSTNTSGGQARTRSAANEWQIASNPLVSDKSIPPIVSSSPDSMEKYFRDGNLIRISNVSGQVVNLAFQENGKMINSWNLDPNDGDQQFRVTRKPGTNQVKLVRKDTNYLISAKDSYADQSLLESWRDVGGFEPHQTWYIDAVNNTPDQFWIRPIGRSENVMNLPLGANNCKLTLSVFNSSDRDQKFGITVLAKDYPPPKIIENITTLTNCKSSDYACTSNGYSGIDPWNFHNSSSFDGAGRKHNCTAYAAFQAARNGQANPGYLGNANTWSANARAGGVRVDGNPTVGSIANRTVGDYGHVAYVEAVNSDGVWISEDNYGLNYTSRRFVTFASGYFQSYIHFGGK